MDSETNPTVVVENLVATQDEIRGTEETRMHAQAGAPMGEYSEMLLAHCEQLYFGHDSVQRIPEIPRLELALFDTS